MDAMLKKMWTDGGGRPLSISVESELFGAAGLGSSAAICSAVAAGLLNMRGTSADQLHLPVSQPPHTSLRQRLKAGEPVRLIPAQLRLEERFWFPQKESSADWMYTSRPSN